MIRYPQTHHQPVDHPTVNRIQGNNNNNNSNNSSNKGDLPQEDPTLHHHKEEQEAPILLIRIDSLIDKSSNVRMLKSCSISWPLPKAH
jgi:hypothetical protein